MSVDVAASRDSLVYGWSRSWRPSFPLSEEPALRGESPPPKGGVGGGCAVRGVYAVISNSGRVWHAIEGLGLLVILIANFVDVGFAKRAIRVLLEPAHEAEKVEMGMAAGQGSTGIGNGIKADYAAVARLVGIRGSLSRCLDLDKRSIQDSSLDIFRLVSGCSSIHGLPGHQ